MELKKQISLNLSQITFLNSARIQLFSTESTAALQDMLLQLLHLLLRPKTIFQLPIRFEKNSEVLAAFLLQQKIQEISGFMLAEYIQQYRQGSSQTLTRIVSEDCVLTIFSEINKQDCELIIFSRRFMIKPKEILMIADILNYVAEQRHRLQSVESANLAAEALGNMIDELG